MTYSIQGSNGGISVNVITLIGPYLSGTSTIQSESCHRTNGFELINIPGTDSSNQIGFVLTGAMREFTISGTYINAAGINSLATFVANLYALVPSNVSTSATNQYSSDLNGSAIYGVVRDVTTDWAEGETTIVKFSIVFTETKQ